MSETAPRPGSDPLAVRCCACLAPPGDPCIGTTSDLPREKPHRLRPLAAASRLVRCPDCEGSGWRKTGLSGVFPHEAVCPVCDALPYAMCTEGGRERETRHRVRRRAARAGLEECGPCGAVGWVPEPAAPRTDGIETGTCSACGAPAERGSSGAWWHTGATCHGGIEWTAKATFQPTAPRPDVPDELRERLLAADLTYHRVLAEDGYASTVGHSNADAADRALAVFAEWLPAHERQVRAQVAAEIEAEHWQQSRIGKDATPLLTAAMVARGES